MTDMVQATVPTAARVSDTYRWTQLAVGVAAMVMIANLQYGWTFFVPDIQKKFGWDRAAIQWAFTLFVLFETWLVPVEGWFVDKYGPRIVVLFGGVLCGIGWAINAYATTLNGFYLGMIIAGIGAGGVYGTCVGNALKWFPDKRGLAAGITAAGFGAGSALTVAPIQAMIKDSGFQATFLYFGIGQGIIICILAFFLLAPKAGQVPRRGAERQHHPDPPQLLSRPKCPPADLLADVLHVRDRRRRRPDGHREPEADRGRLEGRQRSGDAHRRDDDGDDLRGHDRPRAQRSDASVLRLDLRHDRPREHDVHRLRHGRLRHLDALPLGPRPALVRAAVGLRVLRLGRDLLAVPLDLHRHVRLQVRDHQCGPALHRKGHRRAACPVANYMQQSSGTWDSVFIIAAGANILASLLAIVVLKPWRKVVVAKSTAAA